MWVALKGARPCAASSSPTRVRIASPVRRALATASKPTQAMGSRGSFHGIGVSAKAWAMRRPCARSGAAKLRGRSKLAVTGTQISEQTPMTTPSFRSTAAPSSFNSTGNTVGPR